MARAHSSGNSRDLKSFSLHLIVYSLLLALYFFLVLRFFSGWLTGLFHYQRSEYAFAAIILMVGQAVGLEAVSHVLLRFIRGKTR
jgi:predicted tellurium resistance membrane protein TerC